jgi:hypothetical protein
MGAMLLTASVVNAEPSAADKETARTLYAAGMRKLTAGDAEAALADLKKADLIMGVPTTRTAVGKAQVATGHLLDGRDTLLSVARLPRAGAEPRPFVEARDEAARLAEEVAGRIPSLKVVVKGVADPSTLTVSIDGQRIMPELLGAPRKLDPGKHQVKVVAQGYATETQDVELKERDGREVVVEMNKSTATSDVPPASDTPASDEPGSADAGEGEYQISPVVWIGVAMAGAGIIAGAVTGGLAAQTSADLDVLCDDKQCDTSDYEGDLNRGLILAHVSTASFAFAGVGAVLTLVGVFALSGEETSPTESAVNVRVGPGGAALVGRF